MIFPVQWWGLMGSLMVTAISAQNGDALDGLTTDEFATKAASRGREGKTLQNVFPFVGGNRGVPRPIPAQRRFGEAGRFADQSAFHQGRRRLPEPQDVYYDDADDLDLGGGNDLDLQDFVDPEPTRIVRQGQGNDVALDIGTIAAAGERCIDKVVMTERTEYDEEVTCHHSYTERCHITYTTDFEPTQEEKCEENFKKDCFIEYKNVASEETVQFCHTPLVCEGEGPVKCRTVYESQCQTRYHPHDVEDDIVECETVQEEKCEDVSQGYTTERKCTQWPKQVCNARREAVTKHTPETECRKVAKQLCGPSGCQLRPGPEECIDKKETIVQQVPEESCQLEPQKVCQPVTKLVPLLRPREECVDIPKEVCSRARTNPRIVLKPIIKKWCYVPTQESGLA